MKRILAILLCAVAVLVLCCCTSDEKKDNIDPAKQEQPYIQDPVPEKTPEKEPDKEEPEIQLDIKKLYEVDEQVLVGAASKLGFENPKLFHAFANAIGKEVGNVTQQDVDNVRYIAFGPVYEYENSIFVGNADYTDLCFSDAAADPNFNVIANEHLMKSEFVFSEGDTLSDLKKFKNVEIFEIYDTKIDDVSFVKEYSSLCFGYFKNNGITDVSCLEGYNPETLYELDFTGNDIADWTPLEHIKEKVFVFYDINTGISITLDSYLEQKGNNAEVPEVDVPQDKGEKTGDSASDFVIVDADGNPADFSSLFD